MSTALDFDKKSFCLITGASRGIGQTISFEFARKFNNASTMVLVARSDLNETKKKILQINPALTVFTFTLDLTQPSNEKIEKILSTSLDQASTFNNAIIVHNAGSLGQISKKVIDLNNMSDWITYYSLNLFTPAILNSIFVKMLQPFHAKFYILNISSLCGVKAFKNMGQYGSSKAARNMLFQILAEEESDNDFVTLNYCPGPVLTEMAQDIVKHSGDPTLRTNYTKMIEEKTILTTEQTVEKFISILKSGQFKSGDIIDYYD